MFLFALIGQLLDAISTQIGISHGGIELNPIMRIIVQIPILMYVFKLILPILIAKFTPRNWLFLVCGLLGYIPALNNFIGLYFIK